MSSTYKKHYKCVEPPKKIKLLIVAEAPPKPPPKEDENYFYCLGNGNREFFHNLMKVVGLLGKNEKCEWTEEKSLLEKFLEKGCFLIDTSPEALKGENERAKAKEMRECVCSLICQIRELNPEKVLFIKETNEPIRKYVVEIGGFPKGMICEEVFPYPSGNNIEKIIKKFRDMWKKYFKKA